MAEATNTLLGALVAGIRPGRGVKASLQSWLGVPVTLRDGAFWREFATAMGGSSWTGTPVGVDNALQLSTVWACVRLISETISTLPLGFYQRTAKDSRVPASRHPLYEILHNQPNADMTAVVFWEVVLASLLLWGNAYIEVIRSGGVVVSLNFLYPARVQVRLLPDGSYEYRYQDRTNSASRVIAEASMMHVLAFSTDGFIGLSPIAYGANVIGTAIETDKSSAETFKSSLRSPGLVTMDAILKPQQREDIRQHVKKVGEEGGVMVLEKGSGFEKIGFDPVTAELLASRRWNAEELCRLYGVDPAMVGITGKDSNWGTGLEQKMIWFVTLTLRKWCVRIEQGIRKSLLTPAERQTYFAEFAMEGLLRGDSAARASFYSTMTQNGIMKRDECRVLENLPREGGNADVLTVQSNMLPIDKLGQEQAPAPGFGGKPTAPPGASVAELLEIHRRHADTIASAIREAPAPALHVGGSNVTVHVPPQDNAGLREVAAGFADVTARLAESKPADMHLHINEGAIQSNVKIEPTTVEIQDGAIRVEPAATHIQMAEARIPVATEVLEVDRDGNPQLVRETFVPPGAKKAPPAGTVLKIEQSEVIARDDDGHILKSVKTEIQS